MLRLDLKSLREYEESALRAVFWLVEEEWGRPLTRQVVHAIYQEGVRIYVHGGGIRSGADVSYAFYTTRMSRTLPLKWKMRCISGGGANHSDICGRHAGALLVAGTLDYGSLAGISSTWMLGVGRDSPEFFLGLYLNDLLLGRLATRGSEPRERAVG
jgi:hypothetical protein